MGEQPTFKSEAVDWRDIGDQLMAGFLRSVAQSTAGQELQKQLLHAKGSATALGWELLVDGALVAGKGIHNVEEVLAPFVAAFVAPIIGGLFGAEVNASQFTRRLASGEGTAAANAIVDGLIKAISGDATGEIQPGGQGAQRIASAAVGAALESSINALIPEIATHFLPFDFGKLEDLQELPETIISALGISRLVRRALGPYVTITCATPLEWQLNKLHRPTLLAPAQAARQIARGFGAKDTWLEDIRRAGYSEERIAAILNETRHFFSAADVRTFVNREHWDSTKGIAHLRDQGYDEATATDALRLEGLRRIDELETQEANAIIAAYVSGDIDKPAFTSLLTASVTVATERALLTELADVRRSVNIKRLSAAQVASMVKDEILAFPDYRDALAREGYEDFAIDALDLQLRKQIDDRKTIEQHRADQAAERAAAAKARAAVVAAKQAALEAQRAIDRRGKRADLERAAVRGLIPLDRVAEIYGAEFDADAAGILMQLLEGDRQAYLDEQQRRADATKRAAARGIDVGALEQAVLHGVLGINEFRDRLAQLGFPAADAGILAGTLQARLDDVAAAKDAHAAAEAAAKVKHVSLATIETLVRRGHRTLADYDRTLQDLGFDDGARAAMIDLLQDTIDRDRAADAARQAAAAKRDARGLSLEQMRRAVILGLQTVDQFQAYLVDQQFTADASVVLVEELRADVDEADAARQRRADADATRDTRVAPLADVVRAARLGLIPVQVYADRLARDGYSEDAVNLEIDLLVQEMAQAADARAQRDAAEQATRDKPPSLADVARAVKAGHQTLAGYRLAVVSAGYSDIAAAMMTQLLEDELAAQTDAERRRAEVAAAAARQALSLSQLEAGVKAGLLSIDDYADRIRGLGYADDDAALLVALLARQLAVLDQARTRRAGIATTQPEAHAALTKLEDGVKAGLLTMSSYLDELRRRGYGDGAGVEFDGDGRLVPSAGADGPFDDTALLALLLQVALDAKAAKA